MDKLGYILFLRTLPKDDDTDSTELQLTKYVRNNVAVPIEEIDSLPKSEGSWKVITWTGEDEDSTPTLPIYLVVYGYESSTDPIPLKLEDEEKKPFESGAEDEFDINIPLDIGDLFKIRIEFDQSEKKDDTSWSLKKVNFYY